MTEEHSTESQTEMTRMRAFIEKIVTVDQNNNNDQPAIMTKLTELGVETINDLKFLQESDLKDVLKPVQIRKLLSAVQLKGLPEPSPSTCTSGEVEKGPGSPKSQFQPVKFKLETIYKRMPELQNMLETGQRLQADTRRNFVREVVEEVRKVTTTCSKKQFEELASKIVNAYPSTFQDRIDKIRIGTGYDSLLKQFISRNENLNRATGMKRPKLSGHNGETQSTGNGGKRKLVHDSYGCVNWSPSMTFEDEEEEENKRKELKSVYGMDPDWDEVYRKMDETYPLQRKHINSGLSLEQLRQDWPFLVEERVLLGHCQKLLGMDILQAVWNTFDSKGARMLRLFKSRPTLAPLIIAAEKEKQLDNITAILPLVILCLQTCLQEKEESLFVAVDEMSSNEEIEEACCGKSWPRLAMLGTSILAAKESVLVVDGQVIGRFSSFLSAFALLFGVYYILNIQYPNEASATLEFTQRCFVGINPQMGIKSGKKKKTSAVNPKVLKLINELADFEWINKC